MSNTYDVIIIGSGPAGMSAAIYATRGNLKTLIIEKDTPGGQMVKTEKITNYPGYKEIDGATLAYNMYEQVLSLNIPYAYEDVINLKKENNKFLVTTTNNEYIAKNIIIATGTLYNPLGIKTEKKYLGKGISYCAVCDGKLFTNKDILVVGGGDSALKESLYLSSFARKIYLIHRRNEFRGALNLQENVKANSKIEILTPYVLNAINGNETIENVEIKNVLTNETKLLSVSGIFPFIGSAPSTYFLKNLNIEYLNGYIKVDNNFKTNIDNVYAVGDVINTNLRQIVTACSSGAIAAQDIVNNN